MSASAHMIENIEDGFTPFFARYITRQVNRARNPQTVYNFARAAYHFQAWLDTNGLEPEHVSEDDLYRYFRELRLTDGVVPSAGTKRLHAQLLRACYSFAHAKGHITSTPFVDFELPAAPDPDPAASDIGSDELRRMLVHCPLPKHRLLWTLLCFTGARRNELRTMTWEMVDWDARTLTIIGKGSKRRTIPLHPALYDALHAANVAHVFEGAILTPSGVTGGKCYSEGQSFQGLLKKFTDRNFHAFRKTLASSLYRNGVDGGVIDKIMGWAAADIKGKYYVTIRPEELHKAIRLAYLDDPILPS